MSGKSIAAIFPSEISTVNRRVLRYAMGSTLAMAIAMGFDWQLSFLTPVLSLSFLASPAPQPSIKIGSGFILTIAAACFVGLWIGRILLPYPLVYVPFIGVVFFRLYYAKGGKIPALMIIWMIIALLLIPLIMMQSAELANIIALNIVISATATLLIVWTSYGLLPDSGSEETTSTSAPPAQPTEKERFNSARDTTIVVFPVLVLFYLFELTGSLLILIFIALLSMQPGFAKDFKGGKALVIGNLIGGIAAIVFYELLVMVPSFVFLISLTFLAGLFFGEKLFSGSPKAALYGMAYSTVLLVIGSTTSSSGDAEAKVYTRIIQIMIAVTYVVVAFGLLEHYKTTRRKKKRNFKKLKIFSMLSLVITASACTMGPNYTRPEITADTTAAYRDSTVEDESIANLPWWELFGDTVLVNLVDEALDNNRDLRTAMARIAEARANLGIVRSNLYPRIDYSASGSLENTTADNDGSSGSGFAAVDASYQVDLWGRISRSNEAALQELLATEEAYRGVTITLVSEVAASYMLLRDIDNRLMISEYTAETWRRSLDIMQSKHEAGIVSEVELNQSQIQVAGAEAAIKLYERSQAQTENAISTLLSKPPMTIERGMELNRQVLPPEIPKGMPSDLLDRRPDLLVAERKLHAQTARIGVAEALKYPQLNLSADLGAQFTDVTTGFAGLGAQIFGPLFNAGANQRQVEVEIARTQQLLYNYEQSFFTALREVEDAVVAVNTYKDEYRIRQGQVDAAQNATNLSWVRYENGMTSYLEVLDIQRSLFSAQLKASETLQEHLTSTITLYKVLGGGWTVEQDSVYIDQINDLEEKIFNQDR